MSDEYEFNPDDPRIEELARYMLSLTHSHVDPDAKVMVGEPERGPNYTTIFRESNLMPAWATFDHLARIAILWFERRR